MIKLSNINYSYGATQVLFDVSVRCKKGDTLVLLGPSGAGKSSLMRVLNCLEMPKSGQLDIADFHVDFSKTTKSSTIRALRQTVGMVFQQYNLWPHKTVLDNLIHAPIKLKILTKTEALAQAQAHIKALKLDDLDNRYPLQLSGGQQQRVAIARALMMSPRVLLFDEPTAALDPEITAQIANIINELAQTGITQVIVTHDIKFAKKIASHVIYLEQGRVIESGSDIFKNPQTPEFKKYLSH